MSSELIQRMYALTADHEPEGWPAVQMKDITELLERIAELEEIVDILSRKELAQENASLYNLLAHIRAAAGDPEGKLMQDELVKHIRSLAEHKQER